MNVMLKGFPIWMKVIWWLVLNVLIGLTMDFALFSQTTPDMQHANLFTKLIASEFWATVEWVFVVPANRLGNSFLTPAQIALSSYVFDFLAQIWSNRYWLKLPTTVDDYLGMVIIFFGMYASKMRIFG